MKETQEIWVWSLGWEDPLEEGMASHSSIFAWRTMDRGAWWATVHKVAQSQTQLKWLNAVQLSEKAQMGPMNVYHQVWWDFCRVWIVCCVTLQTQNTAGLPSCSTCLVFLPFWESTVHINVFLQLKPNPVQHNIPFFNLGLPTCVW